MSMFIWAPDLFLRQAGKILNLSCEDFAAMLADEVQSSFLTNVLFKTSERHDAIKLKLARVHEKFGWHLVERNI